MWRIDSSQCNGDLVVGQRGDEDRGQVPPLGDKSTLQFPASDVRQPHIEDKAALPHVDVAGKKRGSRGERKYFVATDLGPAGERTSL